MLTFEGYLSMPAKPGVRFAGVIANGRLRLDKEIDPTVLVSSKQLSETSVLLSEAGPYSKEHTNNLVKEYFRKYGWQPRGPGYVRKTFGEDETLSLRFTTRDREHHGQV